MRNFHVTAEPTGATSDGTVTALPFCIQKHAASHLHYDFRLGWNGVLKSWACAKGPSYVVADKRLAVQVEDHPMEYGGFEGIIPAGQYGGGTVMLWDQGTWEPQAGHTDVDAGLRDGSLKIIMHGEKIHGKWALIRMGGKAATERKPNWLLIKEHDAFERSADKPSVTESETNSVVTGRTMEQIAHNEDHVWNSKETAGTGQAWYRKVGGNGGGGLGAQKSVSPSTGSGSASEYKRPAADSTTLHPRLQEDKEFAKQLEDLPGETQPSFLKPQLAMEIAAPPDGEGWLHELKLDGYRIQARKDGDKVQMLTRSGLDWTHRVPVMAQAVAGLPVARLTLDGEVVVLREDGTTNFADLQASFQEGARNPLTYFCFDLLHVEGRNPRGLGLRQRKLLLAKILATSDGDEVRLSEHLEAGGPEMFRKACELHAEGILSKRAAAAHKAGRGGDWLKAKCLLEQEFAVGGYTLSSDGNDRVGSLLLGYYRDGKLIYAGRTGTGFTQKTRRMLKDKLSGTEVKAVPFERPPAEARKGAVWVRPELVAQVRFATWTADDLVRHAAFLGLREDKAATEVRREGPEVAPQPKGEGRKRSNSAKEVKTRTPDGTADAPEAADHNGRGSAAASSQPGTTVQEISKKFYVRPRNPRGAEVELQAAAEVSKRLKKAHPKSAMVAAGPIERAPVRLTHPEKMLDARSGVTKQVLADFYWAVAERMLPHIGDRPLSLVRCPEGAEKPCFFQKHVNHMLPKGLGGVDVPNKKTGEMEPYITLPLGASGQEALAGLAQMGVLEIHPWGAKNDDLERADRLTFDLDPDEALGWRQVTAAAGEVRERLQAIGLESFLKTTGGKGLHLVVPIEPELDWVAIKQFAKDFVVSMERANPAMYLTKMTKAARVGKIYLDYLRNERGATAVAPYSPRARAGMGVSMPMDWAELGLKERPVFAVANFGDWGGRLKADPWAEMTRMRQRVKPERLKA